MARKQDDPEAAARKRGYADGFAGRDKADDPDPAYGLGYHEGKTARDQAHLRLQATCNRQRQLVAAAGGRLI